MAAPFVPPKSTHPKPEVPKWVPPEPTKMVDDWAHLREIDLSKLDSPDPAVVNDLIQTTKKAIKEDGFIYLTNYGVSIEDLHRQFDLAQYTHNNISEEDKERLLWNPDESGLFAGWKPRFGWRREQGKYDGIEQFNFYRGEFEDLENKIPECIKPFMDEIIAFCEYLTQSVNRRLLKLLSRVLELPDDTLWDRVQSHGGPVNDGYFRHALFHPMTDEAKQRMKGVRMYGHTDYGTTTMLFSVPVTALQICPNRDGKWKYVKYNPGAMVINIGDSLEIISGGQFKATLHKVAQPPPDQENCHRLSIVLFNSSAADIRLQPMVESPLLQREGFNLSTGVFKEYKQLIDAGLPVPTNKEWREAQISRQGTQIPPEERAGGVQVINGVKYGVDIIMGVKVMWPV